MRPTLKHIALSAALASACIGSPEELAQLEKQGAVQGSAQALTTTGQSSYWPLPGKVVGQGYTSTWDGPVADLLAADALASCWSSLPTTIKRPTTGGDSSLLWKEAFGDPVLKGILYKMVAATCPAHTSGRDLTKTADLMDAWLEARADVTCNFDAAEGEGASLNLQSTRPSLAAGTWTNSDLTATAARAAEAEIAYADIYLCTAQRLVEHTQSSFVFKAGNEEVLRLYDLARNRALLAVFQYSLLAKVFGADPAQLTGVSKANYGTLAALKDWATMRTVAEQGAAGRDLALAIDSLVTLTEKQVELLNRDASRRGPGHDSTEARARILRALYGDSTPAVSTIDQDLSAPEIGILLGLARSADALDIDMQVSTQGANTTMSVQSEASAMRLYRAAEVALRDQLCPVGDSACRAVSDAEPLDKYRLLTNFGVQLSHATRLVNAFSQAIFGAPEEQSSATFTEVDQTAPGVGRAIKLAAANTATCGVFDHGRVACWGSGLSQPSTGVNWVVKTDNKPLEGAVDIAAASDFACGLTTEGAVYCWGTAIGDTIVSQQKAWLAWDPATRLTPARQISARGTTACFVTSAGSVHCLGTKPDYGVLSWYFDDVSGAGWVPWPTCAANNIICQRPGVVDIGTGARQVTVGGDHGCYLTATGDVYCWGRDDRGQLGTIDGAARTCTGLPCRYLPAKVTIPTAVGKIVSLEASSRGTCALAASGTAYCWGNTASVGSAATTDGTCPAGACVRTPQQVKTSSTTNLTGVVSLAAGLNHMCALLGDGGVKCWGDGGSGRLGTGNTTTQTYATAVAPARTYKAVAAGPAHTCASIDAPATGTGHFCWGAGTAGQLGAGTANSLTGVEMTAPASAPPFTAPSYTPAQRVSRLSGRARKPFHVLGVTLTAAASAAVQRVHIDKEFDLSSLTGHELQASTTLRHVPAGVLDLLGPARGQGFLYRRFVVSEPETQGWGANAFEWGSVPTLALAREGILRASGRAPALFGGASGALTLIDATVGTKSAILRKQLEVADALDNACSTVNYGDPAQNSQVELPSERVLGVCREARAVQAGANTRYKVTVTTVPDDVVNRVAYGPQVLHAFDKALRPGELVMGSPVTDLLGTLKATIVPESAVSGHALQTTTIDFKSPASVLFEQYTNENDRTTSSFLPIFDGSIRETAAAREFASLDGAITTYGGRLNELASEVFAVQSHNWSQARYDAYGIPTDWVPSADPALLGSNGEEPYQYFLRLAEETARQATDAIKQAFEETRQEELDEQALHAANERAASLKQQEVQLSCGRSSCADIAMGHYKLVSDVPTGCFGADISPPCRKKRTLRQALGVEVELPDLVWAQRDAVAPSFADFEGGEIEQRLRATLNSLQRLRSNYRLSLKTFERVHAEYAAAEDEVTAAQYAIQAERIAAQLQSLSLQQQALALKGQVDEARAHVVDVRDTYERVCSMEGFEQAKNSAQSFTGPHDLNVLYAAENTTITVCEEGGEETTCRIEPKPAGTLFTYNSSPDTNGRPSSWSIGALYAWQDRCFQLKDELEAAEREAESTRLESFDAIIEQMEALGAPDSDLDLAANVKTAVARADAAESRRRAAQVALQVAVVTAEGAAREDLNAVLSGNAELKLAKRRLKVAQARYELDRTLASDEVETRQNLRRRYQGYAQWRAEALAENARRTAVAARRAVESRFVVNLSEMGGSEPFVAPPSLWADDVYESDLKPPAAVGVSAGPVSDGTSVYGDRLLDYVSNLKLFVAGYAIQRPASAARNDAEVVTLPAPFAVDAVASGSSFYSLVDESSLGWRFECASGQQVSNPQLVAFGTVDPSAFSRACDGEPPVRAIYRYWVDPWGRVGGNAYSAPFTARYNARWRQLAVNLVGSGIRACDLALDPEECFTEPFLRFDLRHVGPALVTDYNGRWHSLATPAAVIESGKALAIDEWLDPTSRGWSVPEVQAVARAELAGRPLGGLYEFSLELTPDVQLSQIERIQVLTSVDYWVRQN